jgi:hypothetical protein
MFSYYVSVEYLEFPGFKENILQFMMSHLTQHLKCNIKIIINTAFFNQIYFFLLTDSIPSLLWAILCVGSGVCWLLED